MPLPTDPDCYWVEPGLLLAGDFPGAADDVSTRAKLGGLLDCGIRTFVDLTESYELWPYEDVLLDLARERRLAVTYRRKTIGDLDVPSREFLREILSTIRSSITDGAPVYVHCRGGVGRTGTVVGCWLIERGQSGTDVVEAIGRLRENVRKRSWPSPETRKQVEFVRQWLANAEGQ
jgi:protein-tyrosine phosphatase